MIESYKEFINYIESLDYRPKLLLHACCAPCSSHVLLLLEKYFDITVFYSNDNIYPEKEYINRLNEIIKFTKEAHASINVIYDIYSPSDYFSSVKGKEKLGEKSERCYSCYKLRMEKTAKKALELGYDFFTTTLSISPYKIERWINEIGYGLENKYNVKYLYSNFKKDSGYLHSIELSNEYNLYRQDYCGCVFSLEERKSLNDRFKKEDEN